MTRQHNTTPYTVHGVLAGAYKGKDIGQRTLLLHASQDEGRTSVCRRVREYMLCDWKEDDDVTCPECLARIERRGLTRGPTGR